MKQCINNASDRELGKYWERQFCIMAYKYGKCFTPHQWNSVEKSAVCYKANKNIYLLPDITIWTSPGEHHEIKHKNPTKKNSVGLEKYRFDSLMSFKNETKQKVYYTIHNHDLSGGRDGTENNIRHWFTSEVGVNIDDKNAFVCDGYSWVNGQKKDVIMYYWDYGLFCLLKNLWREQGRLFPAHVI